MTPRNPETIKNEIAALGERFNGLFTGKFYDHYSRRSLLSAWRRLQFSLIPLCEELKVAEKYAREQEELRAVDEWWKLSVISGKRGSNHEAA